MRSLVESANSITVESHARDQRIIDLLQEITFALLSGGHVTGARKAERLMRSARRFVTTTTSPLIRKQMDRLSQSIAARLGKPVPTMEDVAPEFPMKRSTSTPEAEGEIRVVIVADIPVNGRKSTYQITFPPVTHHSVTDRATFDRLLKSELEDIRRKGGTVRRVVGIEDEDRLRRLRVRFPEPFPPRPPKHRLIPRQGKKR